MHSDFLIIGAGILSLSIAYKIQKEFPNSTITILEKEGCIGQHASGRNSGVVHSGIYYPPSSLKAKLCVEGANELHQYCEENQIPIHNYGKVILPTREDDIKILSFLAERGRNNGVNVEIIDHIQLKEIQPLAYTITGNALFVPTTSVIEPKTILEHLSSQIQKHGAQLYLNSKVVKVNPKTQTVFTKNKQISYGHMINATGIYATKIAEKCGLQNQFAVMPFKGSYYKLNARYAPLINKLIYPVPDLNVPFLGVHFTKSIHGDVYVGPSAIPALGKENYNGLSSINMSEATSIIINLMEQYWLNSNGFRNYAHNEISRYFKSNFLKAAQKLIPCISKNDLLPSNKVGIRAQLIDKKEKKLVMDFLVERTKNETHILNAVSPAFTSAFSFANYITSKIKDSQAIPTDK